MRAALLAGMSEGEFWKSTPFQTRLFIEAAAERERLAYRRAIWAAWHMAAFERSKRMPKLSQVMQQVERKKPTTRKSPAQLLAMIVDMNAAFGGKDLRNG